MADRRDKPIQAAVFDLDDTLYPERDYVRSGYAAVAGHLCDKLGRDEPFERWLWNRFCRGAAGGAFDELNGAFDLALDGDDVAELVKIYREHRPAIRPYEGMAGLLGRLHERFRLGVLSDGYLPAQRLKLEALKLERFFDAVVFTEQIGRDAWKPAPDGYQAVSDALEVPHDRCAYIADNVGKDFAGANRLGWRTIQYVRPGQIHAGVAACPDGQPQFVARGPDELRAALLEETTQRNR